MGARIKVFVMDVDGTMTDGKIYMGPSGEAFKVFDIKDGYGIHEILSKRHVKTAIITGRASDIVEKRAKELEIDYVLQGVKDKNSAMLNLAKELQCELSEAAYIGDDTMDIPAMRLCAVKGCPADAVSEVKEICDYVSTRSGGNGAVRDFIEWLVKEGLI